MMASNSAASLGILKLERGTPTEQIPTTPLPRGVLNPASYDFPIITETVAGAWVDNVVRGDPTLEEGYIAAAKRLVERGAVAITSVCGFTIRYQKAVAASVNVPVVMSSLLLLPTLLRQAAPNSKIAVLTFDSTYCTEDLLSIGDPEDRARIVVGGIEGGKYWRDEMKRPAPPIDIAAMEREVADCISRLRLAHPEISNILFECAGFPLVAPAIRQITKLPVYDITTLGRTVIASLQ
ncbi:hypothetical protein ACVWXL_000492 [Bradyrhizobium sp. GM22.5]